MSGSFIRRGGRNNNNNQTNSRNSSNNSNNSNIRTRRLNDGHTMTIGVYSNERVMHSATALVGCVCQVKTKNGTIFEGIFKTFSGGFDVVLEKVHEINPNNVSAQPSRSKITHMIVFKYSDIYDIKFDDVDLNYAITDAFTDASISKYNGVVTKEKELEPWDGEDPSTEEIQPHHQLDSNTNGWTVEDMLKTNEQKFNIQSDYDPNLSQYTTPLPKYDTEDFRRHEANAERLAREIENSATYRDKVKLEDGEDEELAFSAVHRPPLSTTPTTDKYIPPNKRKEVEKIKTIDNRQHESKSSQNADPKSLSLNQTPPQLHDEKQQAKPLNPDDNYNPQEEIKNSNVNNFEQNSHTPTSTINEKKHHNSIYLPLTPQNDHQQPTHSHQMNNLPSHHNPQNQPPQLQLNYQQHQPHMQIQQLEQSENGPRGTEEKSDGASNEGDIEKRNSLNKSNPLSNTQTFNPPPQTNYPVLNTSFSSTPQQVRQPHVHDGSMHETSSHGPVTPMYQTTNQQMAVPQHEQQPMYILQQLPLHHSMPASILTPGMFQQQQIHQQQQMQQQHQMQQQQDQMMEAHKIRSGKEVTKEELKNFHNSFKLSDNQITAKNVTTESSDTSTEKKADQGGTSLNPNATEFIPGGFMSTTQTDLATMPQSHNVPMKIPPHISSPPPTDVLVPPPNALTPIQTINVIPMQTPRYPLSQAKRVTVSARSNVDVSIQPNMVAGTPILTNALPGMPSPMVNTPYQQIMVNQYYPGTMQTMGMRMVTPIMDPATGQQTLLVHQPQFIMPSQGHNPLSLGILPQNHQQTIQQAQNNNSVNSTNGGGSSGTPTPVHSYPPPMPNQQPQIIQNAQAMGTPHQTFLYQMPHLQSSVGSQVIYPANQAIQFSNAFGQSQPSFIQTSQNPQQLQHQVSSQQNVMQNQQRFIQHIQPHQIIMPPQQQHGGMPLSHFYTAIPGQGPLQIIQLPPHAQHFQQQIQQQQQQQQPQQ